MPEVHLSALTSIDGDDPAAAATAYSCGWRIDEDYWWVRPLKGGDPASPPGDGHFRDCHVFAACAPRTGTTDSEPRRTQAPLGPGSAALTATATILLWMTQT
jgi:hypothetical protein